MATIVKFRLLGQGRERPTPIEDAAIVRLDFDGERYLQLNGYGSTVRDNPGKRSQNMRLTRQAFEQLVAIGNAHFGIEN
jgi:hypothetical protein